MMKTLLLAFVIAAAALTVLLAGIPVFKGPSGPAVIFHAEEAVSVEVEIADDAVERQVGLMNREFLGEGKGMLFIFERQQYLNFWMKNTLIPLDIIFIDDSLRVVNIQEAVPCKKDPCQFYPSAGPSRYVVEVNQGFSKQKGISPGTRVELSSIGNA